MRPLGKNVPGREEGMMEHLLWKDASWGRDKEAVAHCVVLGVLREPVQRERAQRRLCVPAN